MEENNIFDLPENVQIEMALTQFADENNLSDEFSIDFESGELTFEGFGRVVKPVKIAEGTKKVNNPDEFIKRFKSSGGEAVVKEAIQEMDKKGFKIVKSESELDDIKTKYGKKLFSGIDQVKNKKADSLLVVFLKSLFTSPLVNYVNKQIVQTSQGLIYSHIQPSGLDRKKQIESGGGTPIYLYAIFFREEKPKMKLVKVAFSTKSLFV